MKFDELTQAKQFRRFSKYVNANFLIIEHCFAMITLKYEFSIAPNKLSLELYVIAVFIRLVDERSPSLPLTFASLASFVSMEKKRIET